VLFEPFLGLLAALIGLALISTFLGRRRQITVGGLVRRAVLLVVARLLRWLWP
jgi:hypothetical protein